MRTDLNVANRRAGWIIIDNEVVLRIKCEICNFELNLSFRHDKTSSCCFVHQSRGIKSHVLIFSQDLFRFRDIALTSVR